MRRGWPAHRTVARLPRSLPMGGVVDGTPIHAFEAPGIQTPPGMRMNKSVHWVADRLLLTPRFQRKAHLLPRQIDGRPLFPRLSERLNMYRCDEGVV